MKAPPYNGGRETAPEIKLKINKRYFNQAFEIKQTEISLPLIYILKN